MISRSSLAALGILILLGNASALAESPISILTPATQASSPTEEDATALHRLLEAAQQEAQSSSAPPAGSLPDEAVEETHLRTELVAALEHHLDILERLPNARQQLADQEARTHDWTAFPFSPPYSILLVDQLRDSLDSVGIQIDAANTRRTLVDQQYDEYSKRLKNAEIAARQSDERISQAASPDQRDRQIWLRDLARLRTRAAAAVLAEDQAEKILINLDSAEHKSLAVMLTKQIDIARKKMRFTQADLDGVLANLDRQREILDRRSAQLKSASLQSQRAMNTAQRQLADAKAETPQSDATASRVMLLEHIANLRRFQADNDELAYDITQRTIEVRNWERTGWQYRWLLLNSNDPDKRRDSLVKTDALLAQLQGWSQYIQGERLRAERQAAETDIVPPNHPSPEEKAVAMDYRAAQRERAEILRGGDLAINNLLHTLNLWRQDFLSHDADRSALVIAHDWWSAIRHSFATIWSFELFAAEDSLEIDGQRIKAVRSVTVGKSLGVILLVLFGSWISQKGLKGLRHLAVRHLRVPRNHAYTMAKWSHIVVLTMLVIVALYLANIPLTVFAFLGGALAIGAGFGTQVMLKNMISGVMLLVERPLRVGDIIEVGSVVGTVTQINIRSSTIHTSDGIEILVPNSTFIENNVTNWTYSNPRIRKSVTVGTDYAAPPREVEAVLLKVAARHPDVLIDPPPRVLLTDFGSDAIQFTLRYWIDYGKGADGSQIASDLRFLMAEALAEANIAIPLPQRVVHMRGDPGNTIETPTTKPLPD